MNLMFMDADEILARFLKGAKTFPEEANFLRAEANVCQPNCPFCQGTVTKDHPEAFTKTAAEVAKEAAAAVAAGATQTGRAAVRPGGRRRRPGRPQRRHGGYPGRPDLGNRADAGSPHGLVAVFLKPALETRAASLLDFRTKYV